MSNDNDNHVHDPLSEIAARLERFEAYLKPAPPAPPLPFTDQLVEEFATWSLHDQHNTPRWVHAQRFYLAWWRDKLPSDLRAVSLEQHVLPALAAALGGRQPRIAVLKRLYSWLRQDRQPRLITPAQDPTFGTLHVPQSSPAQWRIVRAIAIEQYREIRRHLAKFWRPPFDVLAGTGWHLTELERFVRRGEIRGGALTCPATKSGTPLRTRVTVRVERAARVLLERGTLSEKRFRLALKEACEEAGHEVKPGAMRHSVATHAVDAGDSVAAVSTFLGHKSERTTKRFYVTHGVPKKIRTMR